MEGERVEAGQGHRRLLNEVLSITAQEWGFRHIRTVRAPILNEVLSITAQEWVGTASLCLRMLLNEVLSITAQELFTGFVISVPSVFVLNEVLSITAQELSCPGRSGAWRTILNEVLSITAQESCQSVPQ